MKKGMNKFLVLALIGIFVISIAAISAVHVMGAIPSGEWQDEDPRRGGEWICSVAYEVCGGGDICSQARDDCMSYYAPSLDKDLQIVSVTLKNGQTVPLDDPAGQQIRMIYYWYSKDNGKSWYIHQAWL